MSVDLFGVVYALHTKHDQTAFLPTSAATCAHLLQTRSTTAYHSRQRMCEMCRLTMQDYLCIVVDPSIDMRLRSAPTQLFCLGKCLRRVEGSSPLRAHTS